MQMAQSGKSYEDEIRNRELMFQAMNQGWGSARTLVDIKSNNIVKAQRN